MPSWNPFKGSDSRPTTPKIGSVPLPESDLHFSEELFSPKKRARTPSILKRFQFSQTNASRASVYRSESPVVPLKRGKDSPPSPLTPESPVACKPVPDTPSSDGSQYFRIEPESRCSTPMIIPPSRPASRIATPGIPILRSPTPRSPSSSVARSPTPRTATPSSVSRSPARARTPSVGEAFARPRARTPSVSETHSSAPQTPPRGPPIRASTPRVSSSHRQSSELGRSSKQISPNRDSPLAEPAQPPPPPNDPPNPELHWQLLPYDSKRSKPYLRFDISHPADLINFPAYTRLARASEVNKLATRVPLTEMVIRCSRLPQWEVHVKRAGAVRCVDVFAAIYDTFHEPLTDAEKETIGEEYLKGCETHWKARCKAAACLTDVEELQGLRRVDLLRGRTMFRGLTCPAPGQGFWVLHLEQSKETR